MDGQCGCVRRGLCIYAATVGCSVPAVFATDFDSFVKYVVDETGFIQCNCLESTETVDRSVRQNFTLARTVENRFVVCPGLEAQRKSGFLFVTMLLFHGIAGISLSQVLSSGREPQAKREQLVAKRAVQARRCGVRRPRRLAWHCSP